LATLILAASATLATSAQAAEPPDDAWPSTTVAGVTVIASRPSTVSGVTVDAAHTCLKSEKSETPTSAPKIVSTYPAKGATVRPGLLVIRVTFDQPMTCGYSFVVEPSLPYPCYPSGERAMLLSDSRRTFRLLCAVRPNAKYGLLLNSKQFQHFVSLAGHPSEPYELSFSTSSEPMIRTVHEALAADPFGESELSVVKR
jgi:hypothetical protein